MSTAYHPQTDGLSERFHRTVEQVLRSYVGGRQDDWDAVLAQCEFAINNSVHSGTEFAPFEVVFGRAPQLPLDLACQKLGDNKVEQVDVMLRDRLAVQREVAQNLQKSQAAMVRQANKHRRDMVFEVGQLVWLKTDHLQLQSLPTKKLSPKWVGPFTVLQVVSPSAYKLDIPASWRRHPVFNISQLKPFHGTRRGWQQPVFTPDQTGDDAVFEVEQLLGHRKKRNVWEFLVRWKHYDASEDTWEPEGNLQGAPLILKQYKRENGLV